jgi:hypothetical protein
MNEFVEFIYVPNQGKFDPKKMLIRPETVHAIIEVPDNLRPGEAKGPLSFIERPNGTSMVFGSPDDVSNKLAGIDPTS